jgi:hypothetical protein
MFKIHCVSETFFKRGKFIIDCEFILYLGSSSHIQISHHLFPKACILYYCLFSSIYLICIFVISSLLLPPTNLQPYYDNLLGLISLLLTVFDIYSSSLHTEKTDGVFIFSPHQSVFFIVCS